jgi:hypothetical protein
VGLYATTTIPLLLQYSTSSVCARYGFNLPTHD